MIIFVRSPSALLLREQLDHLVSAFGAKVGANATVLRESVTGQTTMADVRGWVGTPSLFSTKQLVILRGVCASASSTLTHDLTTYLHDKKLPATTTLVIADLEPLPPATKHVLVAELRRNKTVKHIEVAPPVGAALTENLTARARAAGATLTGPAARLLVERCGNDYDRLINELEKLSLFAASRTDHTITHDDVATTIEPSLEADIFATITALARRDAKTALTLIHTHLARGQHPLYLLTMFRYQFRTLVAVQSAAARDPNPASVAQATGLKPFVARKALGTLAYLQGRDLRATFTKMVDADESIKTSRIQGDVALDLLTLAIAG